MVNLSPGMAVTVEIKTGSRDPSHLSPLPATGRKPCVSAEAPNEPFEE
jgi:hypothetical protein